MGFLHEQIEQIKTYYIRCFLENCREIATPDGIKLSLIDGIGNNSLEKKNIDRPQKQRGWVREEMVVLVAEYFRTKNLSSQESKESISFVSHILRNRAIKNGEKIGETFRNISGIQMQTACIIKYDPEMKEKGVSGLNNGSRLMESIVKEYLDNPEKIKAEAYEVISKYLFCDS